MFKIESKKHDLGGGMFVQRILPTAKKRMVGPFCFFDHMGPLDIQAQQNTDVRPHPHIGLSTLTYLFEGRMVHRDSVGMIAEIDPGDVNWMTAGRGISHSERAHHDDVNKARRLHGLQFWIALPDGKEDVPPSFQHYSVPRIPVHENENRRVSVVAGEAFNLTSPVDVSSPLLLADIRAKKEFDFKITHPQFELAAYLVKGSALAENDEIFINQMLVFAPGSPIHLKLSADAHLVLLGGEPFTTPRHIWWNLVSSSREKIEEAKALWKSGQFPMVPGETEYIPLPE